MSAKTGGSGGRKRRRLLRAAMVLLVVLLAAAGTYQAWQRASVPDDAPLIGVSLDTAWHSQIGATSKTYEIALTRSGGRMVEIRPGTLTPEAVLDRIDALLLTGGGDVHHELSGAAPETTQLVDRERDEFEIALIQGALERDMPIVGICRGIQILNVAHGGTLRDLRMEPAFDETHGINLDSLRAHAVDIDPASSLAGAVGGGGRRSVNSFHGQAVDRVGAGLAATATAPDGIVEGIERRDRRLVVALQWHPEISSLQREEELALFRAVVAEARAYRARRGP